VGRLLLLARLVRGDIRRRRVQSLLLLLMIAATTSTLTIALALSGVTNSPFARLRAATKGPDVSALFEPGFHGSVGTFRQFVAIGKASGVTASSGPFPVTRLELDAHGKRVRVHAEGRDRDAATVDQPLVTAGSWATSGRLVLERGFADALDVHVGDTVRLSAQRFTVSGLALTSAMPSSDPLIWLTRSDLMKLAGKSDPLWEALNLKLADPAAAPAFANRRDSGDVAWFLESWQGLRHDDSVTIANVQQLLGFGSVLLAIVAAAGIAVLVGGRMSEQTRRVGLLKAIGATPKLVAVVLLAENLLIALTATVVGVAVGRLVAPVLTNPGNSMLGSGGSPVVTATGIALAALMAVAVVLAATLLPALRGARTSTMRALKDPARPAGRQPSLIALSTRLPVPLLLAVRLIARRPRRTLLAIASVTISVATLVAALTERHVTVLGVKVAGNVLAASRQDSLAHVAGVLSVILFVVAAINIVVITWVGVIDARRPTAITRALGATPYQVTAGLAGAQIGPALIAAVLGIPLGLIFVATANGGDATLRPPILTLLALLPGTLITVSALTAVPARIGARRPVAEVLRSE
jgi:putative ABC transport system permease protein